MARWRLTEPHYIRVDGTKWEYSEVDRITGRPKRTQFEVPLYINPNFEDDVKSFGQKDDDGVDSIIVSDGNNARPKDIIFKEKDGSKGRPTPGMLPLDDEAKEISASFAKAWLPPSEDKPSYTQGLLDDLIYQMAQAQAGAKAAPMAEGVSEMLASMAAMMKQQTEILAKLANQQAEPKRRVA